MTPEEIKQMRLKLALSQEGLARLLDISYHTINRWETGRFKPSKLAINRIKDLIKAKNE